MNMESLITNCFICEEKSLHIIGENELETQQCINCGYSSADRFKLDTDNVEDNDAYKTLTDDMKQWKIIKNNRIWIPTIMTLPIGIIYPENIDNNVNHTVEMKWKVAKLVEIPEEEQKNFPIPEKDNQFYTTKYDTDSAHVFDEFINALALLNDEQKKQQKQKSELNLPKLKKA